MNRRSILMAFLLTPFVASAAKSQENKTATFKVPEGVTKIRVRSWDDTGEEKLDKVLDVTSNQVFRLDVVG